MPPGSSTVEFRLYPEANGTRLVLTHSGLPAAGIPSQLHKKMGTQRLSEELANYRKELHIDATYDKVYQALTTHHGIAGWWTGKVQGVHVEGGTVRFEFEGPGHIIDMRVRSGGSDRRIGEVEVNDYAYISKQIRHSNCCSSRRLISI